MDEQTQVTVAILATADAAVLPPRDRDWASVEAGPNRLAARNHFLAGGIPWQLTINHDVASKMAAARLLKAIQRAGRINIQRGLGTRLVHVRLTASAEAEARQLVGISSVDDSLRLLQFISVCEVEPTLLRIGDVPPICTDAPGPWISEYALITPPATSRKLAGMETEALPALRRQWLDANSDTSGHVRYRLTPAGRKHLAENPPPKRRKKPPASDPDAVRLYHDTLEAELERLVVAVRPDPKEIGPCPLSHCENGIYAPPEHEERS